MKELEKSARKDLVRAYTKYLEEGETEEVKELAEQVHLEYDTAGSMLPDEIMRAVSKLMEIYKDKGESLSREEVEDILDEIQ